MGITTHIIFKYNSPHECSNQFALQNMKEIPLVMMECLRKFSVKRNLRNNTALKKRTQRNVAKNTYCTLHGKIKEPPSAIILLHY